MIWFILRFAFNGNTQLNLIQPQHVQAQKDIVLLAFAETETKTVVRLNPVFLTNFGREKLLPNSCDNGML